MVGTDFLQLDPSTAPRRGLSNWLMTALRVAMADGRLQVGDRLPATRQFAAELGISRGVVVEVYQRLVDEGVLAGRRGGGTAVRALARNPIRSSPASTVIPVEFDLSPGLPDLTVFPRASWLRAERAVLAELGSADLGYGDPRGTPALREALSGWLARNRGVRADPQDLLVVNGVAQGLALLAQVLRSRGTSAVGVEDPGSRGTRDQLDRCGVLPIPVPVDDLGLDVDALAGSGLDTVIVTPAHQFPTGVVLAPPRRAALLDWVRRGGLIIEDDYDAEHRYDRAPVAALHSLAPEQVAYTGSVSKTLAPALRLGWLLAPARLRDDLVEAKRTADLGSPALGQLALAHLMTSGEFDRHLRITRIRYRQRRDAVLEALAEYLPTARVLGVAAGLHLLVLLPDLAEDLGFANRALEEGVAVHPLSWHRRRPGPAGLVIGYAACSPDRLREAVRRLGALS